MKRGHALNTISRLKMYPLTGDRSFEEAHADDSLWVLSLSDLMSLLLIFFLVWTTIKITRLEKEVASSPRQPVRAQMQLKDMSRIKGMLFEFSPREVKKGAIMIVLDQDVTFSRGSDGISPDGRKMISRIARVLKGSSHYRLKVLGHSDSLTEKEGGRFASNMALSLSRAAAVASELISQGLDPEKIWVQGLGDLYPKKIQGSAPDGINRTVELIVEPSP